MLTNRSDGSGPPLLLLNGGLMTLAQWEPIAAPLFETHRVIRCDLRGQLLSEPPWAASWDEHVADVVELLDHLEIDRLHVAGTSYGGEVAMLLAARMPSRVSKLTVITSTDRTTAAMRQDAREGREIAAAAAEGRGDGAELIRRIALQGYSPEWLERQPPGFLEAVARRAASYPPRFYSGAAALLQLLEELDLTAELPRIEAPTLVIAARGDQVFPLIHSETIARLIPDARLEIVENSGHVAIIEQTARIVELLQRA